MIDSHKKYVCIVMIETYILYKLHQRKTMLIYDLNEWIGKDPTRMSVISYYASMNRNN